MLIVTATLLEILSWTDLWSGDVSEEEDADTASDEASDQGDDTADDIKNWTLSEDVHDSLDMILHHSQDDS